MAGIGAQATDRFTGLLLDRVEQDRAALRLVVGDGGYDILSVQIDMGPGVKTGRFELWLPAIAQGKSRPGSKRVNPNMVEFLHSCEVESETYLKGCTATAQELMALEEGQLLSFPRMEIEQVDLRDCSGVPFAKGKLGQLNGTRAAMLKQIHGKADADTAPVIAATEKPSAIPLAPNSPQGQIQSNTKGFEETLPDDAAARLLTDGTALTG